MGLRGISRMRINCKLGLLNLLFAATLTAAIQPASAADAIRLSGKKCSQGLRSQPKGGPFSVFVF